MAGPFGSMSPWVEEENDVIAAQAAREAAARTALRGATQRHEGAATTVLDHLGESLYNTAARPARIWGALQEVPAGQPLSERSDIVDAVAQTATDMVGLPGIMGGVPKDALGSAASMVKTRDLPMDEASRMARAADQGYTMDAYHATNSDFDHFKRKQNDVGMHFGTVGQADDRLQYLIDRGVRDVEGARTIPAKLKLKNPLRLDDLGFWGSDNLHYAMKSLTHEGGGRFRPEDVTAAYRSSRSESGRIAALRDLAEKNGYDGIVYRNTGETAGGAELSKIANQKHTEMMDALGKTAGHGYSISAEEAKHPAYKAYEEADAKATAHRKTNAEDSYIAFRPNQVRSRFAAFDPANKDSGFLLGANAADRKTAGLVAAGEGTQPFGSMAPKAAPGISDFSARWQERGVRNSVFDRPARNEMHLDDVRVPKDQRKQGIGTEFMTDLARMADEAGRTITLTAAKDFGATSVGRLKEFYKRFGFVENKGRNYDPAISGSMYRPAKK